MEYVTTEQTGEVTNIIVNLTLGWPTIWLDYNAKRLYYHDQDIGKLWVTIPHAMLKALHEFV